jgi:tyrosine-protein phosphatase SIW14
MRIALALSLAALPWAAAPQEIGTSDSLPNFHQVNEHLYRGGQPTDAGFERLAKRGVKTVVDLRGPGNRSVVEKARVESLGMNYQIFPISTTGGPNAQMLREILKVFEAPENSPVYVHCRGGHDRTGVVVACYRISHDGWTNERAEKEAELYGMAENQIAKKAFIHGYHRDETKSGATPR